MTREKEVEIISEKYGTVSLVYGKLHNDTLKGLLKHYQKGFAAGVKWADEHPKSPWISVKEDLPYKHKELLSSDHETKLVLTVDACGSINTDFMSIYEGTWCWRNDSNTVYWHPISDFDKNLL